MCTPIGHLEGDRDLDGNTGDGLHLAALAGAWLLVVAGFGGIRDHGATLTFAPCSNRS